MLENAQSALRILAPLLLLWIGARRVIDGDLSLGAMLALTGLGVATLTPLSSLIAGVQVLQGAGAQLDRLSDVLDAPPEATAGTVATIKGRIELCHASFRYGSDAPWIVRDLNLTIEPGQRVALVGRSGSGKSTVAKLLLGLYEPDEGELRFDGAPMSELDRRSVRRAIGAVLQEPALFRGSIRANLTAMSPEATEERIAEALRLVALDEQVAAMPMGVETLLGEGGAGLSGGQRQRLSLARALIADPAVLLLDEATSHLDAITEAQVERRLGELTCTRIVIAHRLNTIRDADVILVLEDGQIVEQGTHVELLALGGRYAELIREQRYGAL